MLRPSQVSCSNFGVGEVLDKGTTDHLCFNCIQNFFIRKDTVSDWFHCVIRIFSCFEFCFHITKSQKNLKWPLLTFYKYILFVWINLNNDQFMWGIKCSTIFNIFASFISLQVNIKHRMTKQ